MFGDWQRYRSAFIEAIGLLAMSERLPGVTMTVHLAVSRTSSNGIAVISGQDLEFIVVCLWLSPPPGVGQAAFRYSASQVNTRFGAKAAPD